MDGNFPDIPAGVLAKEGGTGTVKYVHQDRYVFSLDYSKLN